MLIVRHDLNVRGGGTLFLGCDPQSSPCFDDPDQNNPTLSSRPRIFGDLNSQHPLGVIVHNVSIGEDITSSRGGGGVNCSPSGIFTEFGSPVFSAYEDSSVGGCLDRGLGKTTEADDLAVIVQAHDRDS